MAGQTVRFSDGARYDAMMGPWSRSAGEIFLDWLSPAPGLTWVDVGCGSGAFTALAVERCSPASILGIDPSEAQLEFARALGLGTIASFETGDAMALQAKDASSDVAIAALVMHFMPDPAKGVAEMTRVVRAGGMVAAYSWDLLGGGFPYEAVHVRLRQHGSPAPDPPHPEAAGAEELRRLWSMARLETVVQREIVVTRSFRDFDEYWQAAFASPRLALVLEGMTADVLADLRESVRADLPAFADGSVVPSACANAISGRVPR
jgi:ubiquinone/menaquinone biosynthesis C-methylase UbiE